MHRTLVRVLTVAAITILMRHADVAAQFGSLTARVPTGANTIVVLDVEKILKSPLATKENWRAQHENAAASGITILPASSKQFLMAADIDFEFMQPRWEVAVSNVTYQPTMPKIAAKWNGTIDRIAERSVVFLDDDFAIVPFGPNILGTYRPGSRQSVGRWMRSTDTSDNRLSPYLKEAMAYTEKAGTPIIMALDLHDVISPATVRRHVEEDPKRFAGVDVETLAKKLSSIRGLTLGITIKDRIYGAVRLDFATDVTDLKDVAKPIFLGALARHSAMIDEMQTWKTKVKGKTIQIGGPLYRSGLQRIMSVLDAPAALQQMSSESTGKEPDPESLTKLSSQQYFKSVSGLVEDLQEKPNKTKVTSMGQVGIWFGRYAKKMDGLPLVNVDSDLIDYGRYVSDAFRQAEAGLRGAGGKTRVAQQQNTSDNSATYGYGYGYGRGRYGSYGPYGRGGTTAHNAYQAATRADMTDRARIRTEIRINTSADARELMQQVQQATFDIRRAMTEKYGVEF